MTIYVFSLWLRGAERREIKALIQVPETLMDELHTFVNYHSWIMKITHWNVALQFQKNLGWKDIKSKVNLTLCSARWSLEWRKRASEIDMCLQCYLNVESFCQNKFQRSKKIPDLKKKVSSWVDEFWTVAHLAINRFWHSRPAKTLNHINFKR